MCILRLCKVIFNFFIIVFERQFKYWKKSLLFSKNNFIDLLRTSRFSILRLIFSAISQRDAFGVVSEASSVYLKCFFSKIQIQLAKLCKLFLCYKTILRGTYFFQTYPKLLNSTLCSEKYKNQKLETVNGEL